MNRNIGMAAVVAIVALVVGLVVISGKLTGARFEIAELRAALHVRQTPAGQVQAAAMMMGILRPLSNVTVRLPGEPVMVAPSAATPPPMPAAAAAANKTNAAPEGASNTVAQATDTNAPASVAERPIQESDLAKAIELMSADWKSRHVDLENAAIASMGLRIEQADAFRDTMSSMNGWMQRNVNDWTNTLESGSGRVTEESCVRILNDLSGTLLRTYTEMDRVLGKNWRDKAPKGFTLTDFVDPSVGIPMVAAQKLLRDRR